MAIVFRRPTPAVATAGLALGMILAGLPHAFAAVKDPFTLGLPAKDTKPPEGVRSAGDGGVSEQMGTASYSFPIEVPKGRAGMQPSLALSYSSGGAVRGGLAVGWSFELPIIERDAEFPNEVRYRTTLSGKSGKLIPNTQDPGSGERYRAEVDSEFVRYERNPSNGVWTARHPDGSVSTFALALVGRSYLTEERDAYGNTVTYSYQYSYTDGYVEYLPLAIEYTANAAANVGPHARVEFTYAPWENCGGVPVGASVDWRFGWKRISGSRRLTQIRTLVKDTPSSGWRQARTYTLSYDAAELSCNGSALRYLTQIDVTGYNPQGLATIAPPVRFGYGPKQRSLSRTITVPNAPREQGTLKGATSGFMDFDGDGRLDHLEVTSDPKCRLHVRKGLADGQFEAAATTVDLPSADWKIPGQRDPQWEYCTLSGQLAERPSTISTKFCIERGAAVTYHFVDWDNDGRMDLLSEPSASPCYMGGDFDDGLICADNGQGTPSSGGCPDGMTEIGTIDGKPNCTCGAGRSYDLSTGSCTSSCPIGQVYNMITGACDSPGTCTFGSNCPDPADPGNPDPDQPQCVGGAPVPPGPPFIWRVQHGVLSPSGATLEPYADASTVTSPRPLPGGGASMGHLHNAFKPQLPTMIDVDGDGYLDLVGLTLGAFIEEPVVGLPGGYLYVWRGKPDGESFHDPVRWRFAGWSQKSQSTTESAGAGGTVFTTTTTLAFRDMNGDGLPDMLVQQSASPNVPIELGVSYNMPGGQGSGQPPDVVGAFSPIVPIAFVTPVEETRADVTFYTSPSTWVEGYRGFVRRLVDMDGDGAQEIIQQAVNGNIGAPAQTRVAYRLLGGARTVDYRSIGAEWEPLESLVVGSRTFVLPWKRHSDFIDLTGDGLPDTVYYDNTGTAVIRTDAVGTPLRLLASIDNGRGGLTRFDYALSNDGSAVDLDGVALSPRWVVSRVTVSPGQGQPDMKTSYSYFRPVIKADGPAATHPKAPGFVGFTKVTIDSSGQPGDDARRVIKEFDYWSVLGSDGKGVLATEETYLKSGGQFVPVRHADHWYSAGTVAGSAASFTFRTFLHERVCLPGQDMDQCKAQTAKKTTADLWVPWAPLNGPIPQIWLNTRTETSDGVSSPRYVKRDFIKWWSATQARIAPTIEEKGRVYTFESVGGTQTWYLPWAKTETVYDALGMPVETRVYRDSSNYSRTLRTFHPYTGVVQTIRHPNEVASGSYAAERFYYEAFMVNVTAYADQSGATRFDTIDMATGALLQRRGPSWRYTNNQGGYAEDTESWTIDGFGRPLTHTDSLEPAPGVMGYDVRQVEMISYFDNEVPNRRMSWKLQTVSPSQVWVATQEEYDGAGRVFRATAFGGALEAVTTYAYDAGGQVRSITAPSPTGTGTVTTLFTRDGLGRVTQLDRPDGSGEVVTYTGLRTESIETSSVDGPGARTTLVDNQYGELVQVHEHDNPVAGQVAITTYSYDPLGRMQTIVDADGGTTTMAYDWRGLRTSVTRAGKTWTYAYDLNGNMTEQNEPLAPNGTVANHKSVTTYDVLNRPKTHTPASRGMSAANITRYGLGTVTFSYDGNGFYGKPHAITLGGFGSVALTYEPNGQVAKETRTITLNATHGATLNVTQWVERRYDALGHPASVKWDDGTEWKYAYDSRGDLADVIWRQNGVDTVLAHYDRFVAGNPYRRTSAWSSQQRDWQYDVLGRVTYDRVWRPASGQTLHERTYGYDGRGELRLVDGATAGMNADAVIDYDARHRVKRAQGPMSYDASFTYSKTGNVLTAKVFGAAGELNNRDVVYGYSAADPQAVEKLTDATSGSVVASWSYDHAGAVASRGVGWSSQWFTFGGDNLLHEVSNGWTWERYLFGPGAERMVAIGFEGVKVWFGESETLFGYDGVQQRRYHHIAGGEPVARAERTTAGSAPTLELQYADTLQSLVLAVAQNGTVNAAFVYGAFGEVVGAIGAGNHRREFNGKELDMTSGLRHYGYRSYDAVALRWVSADPLFRFAPDAAWTEPQRANLYAFSLNNPMRFLDPDGRNSDEPNSCPQSDSCELPEPEELSCPQGESSCAQEASADTATEASSEAPPQDFTPHWDSMPKVRVVLWGGRPRAQVKAKVLPGVTVGATVDSNGVRANFSGGETTVYSNETVNTDVKIVPFDLSLGNGQVTVNSGIKTETRVAPGVTIVGRAGAGTPEKKAVGVYTRGWFKVGVGVEIQPEAAGKGNFLLDAYHVLERGAPLGGGVLTSYVYDKIF